jgi:DNA-binding protein H-NS
MKLETLDNLNDADLQAVITRAGDLLKQRDCDRKDKAKEDARAILAAAGLSFKDLNGKSKPKAVKAPVYHTGHTYQHPTDKSLTWNGKGKRPAWIVALESKSEKAVEVMLPEATKKTG